MGEDSLETSTDGTGPKRKFPDGMWIPVYWFQMLASETHWSFVLGVVVVYGISQGLGGAIYRVSSEYYMKDVQKVQPSEAQFYFGITSIPWIVKPLWGLLTDVVPVSGYRRRPYFILAGSLGILPALLLSFHSNIRIMAALLALTAVSAGVAIADVTADACVVQNTSSRPRLAADMQSLCAICSSAGALLGYGVGGILIQLIGPKGVFGVLSIPAALVLLVGLLLKEVRVSSLRYEEVRGRFAGAGKAMRVTLMRPDIWKPCLYMYLSLSACLHISQGMFYWSTDSPDGPRLSKEAVGYIMSIGSAGSLLGAVLYQSSLKRHPFRDILFWMQLLYAFSGTPDLLLVLRVNLRVGIPDTVFIAVDAVTASLIGRLKWMPLLVLSSKLCPPGIEGTFFALLMSIDNAGLLTSSWLGSLLLHSLGITRTRFDRLWLAILFRNFLRLLPIAILFLIPRAHQDSSLLPPDDSKPVVLPDTNLELISLVPHTSTPSCS